MPQKEAIEKEGEEIAKTTFRMPKSLLKDVQRFGIDHDMTDTQIFNQAIKEWMDRQQKKGK